MTQRFESGVVWGMTPTLIKSLEGLLIKNSGKRAAGEDGCIINYFTATLS